MQCFHPSEIYSGGRKLTVPCNRCMACRINKTFEWSTRLTYEMDDHDKSVFVTLTYDDDHIGNPSLSKADFQKFIKRVRKHYFGNKESDLAYYLCGEYGPTTFRKHGHAAMFGVDFEPDTWEVFKVDKDGPHYTSSTLLKLWPFGFNEVGLISPTRLNYVTGYIQKKLFGDGAKLYKDMGVIPPFQLFSRGLGVDFVQTQSDRIIDNGFVSYFGKKMPIPKYYSRKIGLSDMTTDEGVNLRSQLAYDAQVEAMEDWMHRTGGSRFDYADYVISARLQKKIELSAKEEIVHSRSKI